MTSLRYMERGKDHTAALLPGWASDYRIFDSLNIEFNYLLPADFLPGSFEKDLLSAMEKLKIRKVSLFGWSLGGFCAASFASKYPELVNRVVLVGIRRRYDPARLKEIRSYLGKNRKGYLYKFYSRCFHDKDNFNRFRKSLLRDYCETFTLEALLDGLDLLGKSHIDPAAIGAVADLKIIHGEFDEIAPYREVLGMRSELPRAEFIAVKGAGHAAFLEKDFNKLV